MRDGKSALRNEPDDEDDERYDQQGVDQIPAEIECESKEPQNDESDDDCPKHGVCIFTQRY
jgi:hypothetical protein